MKALTCISLLLGSIILFQTGDAFDYCYRASFTTDQAVSGNATSRKAEIETAVNDILNELRNDTNLGFTTSGSNATLEQVDGNSSRSIYVVSICLTNSSLDQDQLTGNLETFNFTTQIDNEVPEAGDFDECTSNFTTNCAVSPMATCNNNNGSFACACPDTYADRSENNATGQICELPTNHTCETETVNVTAYLPYFTNLGISESTLMLGNCNGTVSGDTLLFSGECSPLVQGNGSHIIYRWNLTNVDPDEEITVGNYVTIPIICSFPSNATVNVTFNGTEAEPVVFGDNLFLDNAASTYNLQITAFSGTGFASTLSAGAAISTNQDLGFEMGPQDGFINDNLRTVCQGLSSGPAEGTIEPMRLIDGGCTVTNPSLTPLLNTINIINQGVGPVASLTLRSHFYYQSTVTQLNFEINICYESGGSSCQPSCNSRRRRSVFNTRIKRQSVLASGVGHFVFRKDSTDNCTRDCGLGVCVLGLTRDQECACSDLNTYRDASGKCLSLDELESVERDEEVSISLIVLVCVISVLFIGAILIAVAIIRTKRDSDQAKFISEM